MLFRPDNCEPGGNMFELTQDARQELDAYFADKEKSPIRVYLASGGCSGPRLALALDAPGDDDAVFDENGYVFCIDKELQEHAGDVKVDLTPMGFIVESANEIGGGGGCSGCASAGGCHTH
jgi:Fe-S cluster assembly iron-binding protein IscA